MDAEKVESWRKLCRELVDYCATANPGSIVSYAGAYAKAGIDMSDPDEISTQAIYIVNNLKHYSSPAQKTFKQRLREFY